MRQWHFHIGIFVNDRISCRFRKQATNMDKENKNNASASVNNFGLNLQHPAKRQQQILLHNGHSASKTTQGKRTFKALRMTSLLKRYGRCSAKKPKSGEMPAWLVVHLG